MAIVASVSAGLPQRALEANQLHVGIRERYLARGLTPPPALVDKFSGERLTTDSDFSMWRSALSVVLGGYVNPSGWSGWTLSSVLAAVGNLSGTWLNYGDGNLSDTRGYLTNAFNELVNVTNILQWIFISQGGASSRWQKVATGSVLDTWTTVWGWCVSAVPVSVSGSADNFKGQKQSIPQTKTAQLHRLNIISEIASSYPGSDVRLVLSTESVGGGIVSSETRESAGWTSGYKHGSPDGSFSADGSEQVVTLSGLVGMTGKWTTNIGASDEADPGWWPSAGNDVHAGKKPIGKAFIVAKVF